MCFALTDKELSMRHKLIAKGQRSIRIFKGECHTTLLSSQQCVVFVTFLLSGQWLCGLVGRAVTSDIKGPRFESSHQQKFIYIEHLFTVNCVLKRQK